MKAINTSPSPEQIRGSDKVGEFRVSFSGIGRWAIYEDFDIFSGDDVFVTSQLGHVLMMAKDLEDSYRKVGLEIKISIQCVDAGEMWVADTQTVEEAIKMEQPQ